MTLKIWNLWIQENRVKIYSSKIITLKSRLEQIFKLGRRCPENKKSYILKLIRDNSNIMLGKGLYVIKMLHSWSSMWRMFCNRVRWVVSGNS